MTKTTPKVGSWSQAPLRTTQATRTTAIARTRGNPPPFLGLTNLEHVARFNCLSSRRIVVIRYYDDELLNQMGLLDDIRWLFARGEMGQFIELRDHTPYLNLRILEYLTRRHHLRPRCQQAYISFYLQGQFYE